MILAFREKMKRNFFKKGVWLGGEEEKNVMRPEYFLLGPAKCKENWKSKYHLLYGQKELMLPKKATGAFLSI